MADWMTKERQKLKLPPLVAPLMNTLKFDYRAGSIVLLKTKVLGSFRGQVFQNPLDTGIKNSLTLINVTNVDTGELVPGHHTFYQNDIVSVTGLEVPEIHRRKSHETVMETFVVGDLEDLNRLINALKNDEDVGCYIPGVSMGRFSSPKFIVLNVRYVLIIIPIENFLGNEQEFWRTLGTKFFGTSKFTKVFLDSRGITDYLYNHHEILVKRVFDLQFTELCLKHDMSTSYVEEDDPYYRMESVSYIDLLQCYLPNYVPPCDVSFLGKFGQLSESSPNKLSSREKKYCALRAKYLLKLKQEMFQRIMSPALLAVDRKCREMIATENVFQFQVKRY